MEPRWTSIGASVAGSSHEKKNTPCQDAHCSAAIGQYFIGAVADGAGTAARAQDGSRLATATALEHLNRAVLEIGNGDAGAFLPIVRESMSAARTRIRVEAERASVPIREYATTLIVFVSSPVWIVACQIGDGALVLLAESGELVSVTRPPPSEFINETSFLTFENWESERQEAEVRRPVRCVAAFSDGLQQLALKFPAAAPFEPFFSPLFSLLANKELNAAQQQLEDFLRSSRVNDRTDDDKTLLLAKYLSR